MVRLFRTVLLFLAVFAGRDDLAMSGLLLRKRRWMGQVRWRRARRDGEPRSSIVSSEACCVPPQKQPSWHIVSIWRSQMSRATTGLGLGAAGRHAGRTAERRTSCERHYSFAPDRSSSVAARRTARSPATDGLEEGVRSGGVRHLHRAGGRRAPSSSTTGSRAATVRLARFARPWRCSPSGETACRAR